MMKKLINRVQQDLDNNAPVEADDIQALVDHAKRQKEFTASEIYVWRIRDHGSGRRLIIAPKDVGSHEIDRNLSLAEYVNECNTFLGYFEKDADFILKNT